MAQYGTERVCDFTGNCAFRKNESNKTDGEGFDSVAVSSFAANELCKPDSQGAAQSGAFSADLGAKGSALSNSDLALLIDRWPTLPAATRTAIKAMIQVADPTK
jgi:hypothetical protein